MLRITVILILCFFAAVGMAHTYNRYISFIFEEGKNHLNSPYLVITAKNQQENIETAIRSLIWKSYRLLSEASLLDIVVVDLGSDDDTPVILKQLEEEYDFLHLYSKQDYIDKIAHDF